MSEWVWVKKHKRKHILRDRKEQKEKKKRYRKIKEIAELNFYKRLIKEITVGAA